MTGDSTTAKIMIEDGAYFKGSIEIDRCAEKIAEKQAHQNGTALFMEWFTPEQPQKRLLNLEVEHVHDHVGFAIQ